MSLQALFPSKPCPDKRFHWHSLERDFFQEKGKDIPIDIKQQTIVFLEKQKKDTEDFLHDVYVSCPELNYEKSLKDMGDLIDYTISTGKQDYPYVVVDGIFIRPCALGKGLFDKFINNIVEAIIEKELKLGLELENTGYYLNAYCEKFPNVWRKEEHGSHIYWKCDHETMVKNKNWFYQRAHARDVPNYDDLSNEKKQKFEKDCDDLYAFYHYVLKPVFKIFKQREHIRGYKNISGIDSTNFDEILSKSLDFSKHNSQTCYSLFKIIEETQLVDRETFKVNEKLIRKIKDEL